ncbi:hypothetical protein SLA2020_463640 [Shorea laevis]
MEGRLLCFMLALQIVSWVSATSRPLAPHNSPAAVHPSVTGQIPKSLSSLVSLDPNLSLKESPREAAINSEEAIGRGGSRIGSSPPSCEHKCYGCTPCEAIQVPTNSKHNHVGLQYTNYEPEGWKCKCGPSFYSP